MVKSFKNKTLLKIVTMVGNLKKVYVLPSRIILHRQQLSTVTSNLTLDHLKAIVPLHYNLNNCSRTVKLMSQILLTDASFQF